MTSYPITTFTWRTATPIKAALRRLVTLSVASLLIAPLACSGGGGGSDSSGSGDTSSDSNDSGSQSADDFASFGSCATKDLDRDNLALLDSLLKDFLASGRLLQSTGDNFAPIPIIFHVITKGDSYDDGNVPDSQLIEQVDVLNRAFSGSIGGVPTPFRFVLSSINRVNNPSWFDMLPGSQAEIDAKAALHQGGANTLNFYTVNTDGKTLGFSTFPILFSILGAYDGVVINFKTLPNGPLEHYKLGLVGVHEAGHWLGLLHTFQGECDNPLNDLVQDTPAEALPQKGDFCPINRDSCSNSEGLDPIHNHMTYTVDTCRFEFTQGQLDLMRLNAILFRQLLE